MKNSKHRYLRSLLLGLSLIVTCGSAKAADTIVEVAEKTGSFKTLLTAAKAAGLVDVLQGSGPLTVFAPTDDAFAKLPPQTFSNLLKPENKEKLAAILKYHVVSARVAAKDAVQVESAATLSGDPIGISIRDGRLAVNDANVIVNDVEASNGIIHVIDTVLLPPEKPVTGFKAGADIELLKRINPSFESDLKSKAGGKTVSVSFCNLSSEPMQVFWLQPNGERKQWRGQIAPGKLDVCEKTFQNHVWLIADQHAKTIGLYVVGDKDALIVNTH